MEASDFLSSELSAATLAALQGHLREEEARKKADDEADDSCMISEDFRLAQFWYDQRTAEALAREAIDKSNGGRIAFLSCPAAFQALREIAPDREDVYLFEFDERFGKQYGDAFVFYNYYNPTEVPADLHHTFDFVLADPPHLNVTAFTCFVETMNLLSKETHDKDYPKVLMTGQILHQEIKARVGYQALSFRPTFKSKLSNEFLTYANYHPSTHLGDLDPEYQ